MAVEDEIAPTEKDEITLALETDSSSVKTVSGPAKSSEKKADRTRIMIPVREKPSKTSYEMVAWILDKIIRNYTFAPAYEFVLRNIQPRNAEHVPLTARFETPDSFDFILKEEKTHATASLIHLVRGLYNRNVHREGRMRKGRRHIVICREAEEIKPDLLVVEGPRPDLAHRMLHRNISKYCLKHAKCPVLVFPFVPETQAESASAISCFDALINAPPTYVPGDKFVL